MKHKIDKTSTRGRKTLSPTGEVMRGRNIRMTDDDWNTLINQLGGSSWVRAKIRSAKVKE